MDPNTFPTKGNLILAKNSLKLAHMGYELMDKKRNILIRELMGLIDEAKDIQRQIDVTFREAYAALQIANMEIGITNVQTVSYTVPVEESIRIKTRSIMGVEIPLVEADPSGQAPTYAYYSTKESLDQARQAFEKVKDLTLNLSMIENSAYRLAAAIKKTQKRAIPSSSSHFKSFTVASSLIGRLKSQTSPFTLAARTSCAKRELMLSAICIAVVPFAYSLTELSGNVIFIIFYSLKFFIFSPQS